MDPNANLAAQEELLQEMHEYEENGDVHHPAYFNAQADLVITRIDLEDWFKKGGFEPDWTKAPNARKYYGR
jgi:hypothetical protein